MSYGQVHSISTWRDGMVVGAAIQLSIQLYTCHTSDTVFAVTSTKSKSALVVEGPSHPQKEENIRRRIVTKRDRVASQTVVSLCHIEILL